MDKAAAVHRRKKRYMGRVLGRFDEHVAPHLPQEVADEFKGEVRAALHGFALDCCEIISLSPGEEQNGHAVELRDRLGIRPTTRSTSE